MIDAIRPETFTFREIVVAVGEGIDCRRPIMNVPPWLARWVGTVIGRWKHDVTITPEEIDGLMSNLLLVSSSPDGNTRLTQWVREHADELGTRYANALQRRRDRELS